MLKNFALLAVLVPTMLSAQLTSMTAPTNASGVFWDNFSNDGQFCNIGYVVTGQAGNPAVRSNRCTNQRPTWLPYVGPTPTTQLRTVGFGKLFDPTLATITVYGDIAGGNTAWGWYDATTGVRTNLTGMATNSSVTVGSTENMWGLFIERTDGTFATSDVNGFAFFGFDTDGTYVTNDFIVGGEDTVLGDEDYNDVVFRIQSQNSLGVVPEPTTYLLMSTGLIGVFFLRRKLV